MGESDDLNMAAVIEAIASSGITADEVAVFLGDVAATPEFAEFMKFWNMCMATRETPPDENSSSGA